ncbi:hypothetical protein MetexDRAFT_6519 [Methylorubrum extorquens DSM 13060]|uniref:Uncharacterized protein n=1 Tax=Methylorubrum extorquens DSM 13060 TaxID=882800 RepID=H1KV56_METEX|nr:hypothetical protein MetexDRAFT_6519 [Methylorubrum extorquens DSM 13060]MCP1546336.1 hypothetical protein [Methylorubrum extorquens]MCP1591003.1 hypothetical protein [Methylorubrum extorquens]
MTRLPNTEPNRSRQELPLNEGERALVVALAKWKARIDYERWCDRLPRNQHKSPSSEPIVRVSDISKNEYTERFEFTDYWQEFLP